MPRAYPIIATLLAATIAVACTTPTAPSSQARAIHSSVSNADTIHIRAACGGGGVSGSGTC